MARMEDRGEAAAMPRAAAAPSVRGDFLSELRRRRVFRVLLAYGIVSFAVLQIIEPVMHGLHLPEWVLSAAVVALGLGFPVAIGLAWAFDLTPTGVERTPSVGVSGGSAGAGSRVSLLLAGLGLLAAAPGLAWYFVWRNGSGEARLGVALAGAALLFAVAALTVRSRRRVTEPPHPPPHPSPFFPSPT
jgi:hypothetical protein